MARVFANAIVMSASILFIVGVRAQTGDRSDAAVLADLKACSTLARDGARLACFDGVLAAAYDASSSDTTDRAVPAAPRAAAAPAREPVPARPVASGSASAVVTAAQDTTRGRAEERDDRSERGDEGGRSVTIVEIQQQRAGEASFVTDTGQIYIQTSGGTPAGGYPEVPYETTLRDGALGSLFLYLNDRRRVRVKRAE